MYYPRLKDLREDGDYVQKEIVAYLGIDQRVYNTYETGKREIPPAMPSNWRISIRTSTDYILGQSDIQGSLWQKASLLSFSAQEICPSESATVRKQHRRAAVSPSWESR